MEFSQNLGWEMGIGSPPQPPPPPPPLRTLLESQHSFFVFLNKNIPTNLLFNEEHILYAQIFAINFNRRAVLTHW